jgi:hypothetical protein
MKFSQLNEFSKELKKFSKKYYSIEKDLEEFKKILNVNPEGTSKHFNILTKNQELNIKIIKARFFCQYLKGATLRIVYAYFTNEDRIEFIELYFKGDKETENKERILDYLK